MYWVVGFFGASLLGNTENNTGNFTLFCTVQVLLPTLSPASWEDDKGSLSCESFFHDAGNILQSPLGGNGKGQGALNIIYSVYLVLSTPPFEYVARHSMLKVRLAPGYGALLYLCCTCCTFAAGFVSNEVDMES